VRLRYTNGGAQVLENRLPVTVSRLRAMVGPVPVAYRVEDAHTYEWREATGEERARIRAWLRRFIRQRGCSPVGTHPVHHVGVVFFVAVSN
jgi:hypothetical protein